MSEELELRIRVERDFDVNVDTVDLIAAVNDLPILKRWNVVAQILNTFQTKNEKLTESQTKLIITFLNNKLKYFSEPHKKFEL